MKTKLVKETLSNKLKGPSKEEIKRKKEKIFSKIKKQADEYSSILEINEENGTIKIDASYDFEYEDIVFDNSVIVTLDLKNKVVWFNMKITSQELRGFVYEEDEGFDPEPFPVSIKQGIDFSNLEDILQEFLSSSLGGHKDFHSKVNNYLENEVDEEI